MVDTMEELSKIVHLCGLFDSPLSCSLQTVRAPGLCRALSFVKGENFI